MKGIPERAEEEEGKGETQEEIDEKARREQTNWGKWSIKKWEKEKVRDSETITKYKRKKGEERSKEQKAIKIIYKEKEDRKQQKKIKKRRGRKGEEENYVGRSRRLPEEDERGHKTRCQL